MRAGDYQTRQKVHTPVKQKRARHEKEQNKEKWSRVLRMSIFFSMVIRLIHWTNEFMERVKNVPTEIFIISITLSERAFCISNDGQRLYEYSGGR